MPATGNPPPLYAVLYQPPVCQGSGALVAESGMLVAIAGEFSPRYEQPRGDLLVADVRGLERLLGEPRRIGEELWREATARGLTLHIALAATRSAAVVTALARPGLSVIEPGRERERLAPVPIAVLERMQGSRLLPHPSDPQLGTVLTRWGIRTLGEIADLPAADLASRLGSSAAAWQAIARGDDLGPLVPMLPEERFESSLDLEWPIDDLEPLSFVLTRLLEPLSTRLERRDRGAAALHLALRLVTRDVYARTLPLPSPLRDVRTLRTLLLLDLDAHRPPAAIDRVTLTIDPTPGPIVQHTLFTRAHPTPEQLSTLLARLTALMGQDRIGAPAVVDTDRPGTFDLVPFATDHDRARDRRTSAVLSRVNTDGGPSTTHAVVSALRRYRHPVPARVTAEEGCPVRVTADRRGFAGGAVVASAGPWRTSGEWWRSPDEMWDRDEWDVALAGGPVYRIFRDRRTGSWFVDALVD